MIALQDTSYIPEGRYVIQDDWLYSRIMVNPFLYHTGVEDPLGCDALKTILEMVVESRR